MTKVNPYSRGMLAGHLDQSLETAVQSLVNARRGLNLLSKADGDLLQRMIDTCMGLRQRVWVILEKESKAASKVRKKERKER